MICGVAPRRSLLANVLLSSIYLERSKYDTIGGVLKWLKNRGPCMADALVFATIIGTILFIMITQLKYDIAIHNVILNYFIVIIFI